MASIQEQLTKIAVHKTRLSSGETIAAAFAREVHRLYSCIQHYINEYYAEYNPVIYNRTYRFQRALYAEDLADIRVVGNTIQLSLRFAPKYDQHPNLDGVWGWSDEGATFYDIENQHMSPVSQLMEWGWYAPRLEDYLGESIEHLTYFKGIHAIERGIRDFNKTNKLGIKVDYAEIERKYRRRKWY